METLIKVHSYDCSGIITPTELPVYWVNPPVCIQMENHMPQCCQLQTELQNDVHQSLYMLHYMWATHEFVDVKLMIVSMKEKQHKERVSFKPMTSNTSLWCLRVQRQQANKPVVVMWCCGEYFPQTRTGTLKLYWRTSDQHDVCEMLTRFITSMLHFFLPPFLLSFVFTNHFILLKVTVNLDPIPSCHEAEAHLGQAASLSQCTIHRLTM